MIVVAIVAICLVLRERGRQTEIDRGFEAIVRGEYAKASFLLAPVAHRDPMARSGSVRFALYLCKVALDEPDPEAWLRGLRVQRSAFEKRLALHCARQMLADKHIIELDPERRAAMVSNLLVVLCGHSTPQPVLNTGTLYN